GRRRHTSSKRDWSSDVCSSDLIPSDLVDVGRAEDLLHRDDPLGRRLLLPEEVGDEGLHAGAGEEDARIVLQDERPAGHTGMALLLEEGDESLPYGRAVYLGPPRGRGAEPPDG